MEQQQLAEEQCWPSKNVDRNWFSRSKGHLAKSVAVHCKFDKWSNWSWGSPHCSLLPQVPRRKVWKLLSNPQKAASARLAAMQPESLCLHSLLSPYKREGKLRNGVIHERWQCFSPRSRSITYFSRNKIDAFLKSKVLFIHSGIKRDSTRLVFMSGINLPESLSDRQPASCTLNIHPVTSVTKSSDTRIAFRWSYIPSFSEVFTPLELFHPYWDFMW